MIVDDSKYREVYDAVKVELRELTELEKKIPIFVDSNTADSICTLRIVTQILETENIHFSIFPVARWHEVQEKVQEELADKQEILNMIFINCGGTEDLVQLLDLDLENEKQRALVIDSHRPIHTQNSAIENQQVIVLVSENEEQPPTDLGEIDSGDDGHSEEEEEPLDEEDDDGDENEPPLQRQRTERETEASKQLARKRHRRRLKDEKQRQRIEYYSRGASRGHPASCIAYELCRQLNKEDNLSLWLSIVGLTDLFVNQLISTTVYQSLYNSCRQQMTQLGNTEMQDEEVLEDGLTTRIPLNRRISEVQDYRFTLMRHWNLHDAMLYSPFVATRLQTWREKGRHNLQQLLARMGCSLQQCKQQYVHMNPELKEQLPKKLDLYAPQHNLPDVKFDSFLLEQGFKTAVTASDAVHAVTAILCQSRPAEESKENFWQAYAAMRTANFTGILKGIELAKKLHKTLLDDGGSIMARRSVQARSNFRFVNLSDGEVTDRALLAQPISLSRLGAIIQDAYYILRSKVSPVLVIGPEEPDHFCLIVGYAGRPKATDISGNRFGNAFVRAQEASNCDLITDYFDQYTVKLAKSDVPRFIDHVNEAFEHE